MEEDDRWILTLDQVPHEITVQQLSQSLELVLGVTVPVPVRLDLGKFKLICQDDVIYKLLTENPFRLK